MCIRDRCKDGPHVSSTEYAERQDTYRPTLGKMIRDTAFFHSNHAEFLQYIESQSTVGWFRCFPHTGFIHTRHELLGVARKVLTRWPELGVEVSPVIFPDGSGSIVIQRAGVDKVRGLFAVCEDVGTSFANLIAFGDGENDVGMLAAAGDSVCPSNATVAAKTTAKRTSSLSNDEDFIAEAIFALVDEQPCSGPNL